MAVSSLLGCATTVNGKKVTVRNAAFGVKVQPPKKVVAREEFFRAAEISAILNLARSVAPGSRHPRASASPRRRSAPGAPSRRCWSERVASAAPTEPRRRAARPMQGGVVARATEQAKAVQSMVAFVQGRLGAIDTRLVRRILGEGLGYADRAALQGKPGERGLTCRGEPLPGRAGGPGRGLGGAGQGTAGRTRQARGRGAAARVGRGGLKCRTVHVRRMD